MSFDWAAYPGNCYRSPPLGSDEPEQILSTYLQPQLNPYLLSPQAEMPVMSMDLPSSSSSLSSSSESLIDGLLCGPGSGDTVQLEIQTYTDLLSVLSDMATADGEAGHYPTTMPPPFPRQWSTEEDLLTWTNTELQIPSSVRLNIESSHMLESLMYRAATHWCCVGFKVAPINQELIRNWRLAPPTIVYCVASISLVTFMDHQAGQSFVKEAAMMFYEQARQKMDDVLFDDMEPLIIQSYFCLSYTSNLLRLYEQQRTWGGLASIALQQRVRETAALGQPMDDSTILCWCRWYYVDAWMCLTLKRECLLSDDAPPVTEHDLQVPDSLDASSPSFYRYNLSQFATLAHYMRRYMRAMRSGEIHLNHSNEERLVPSPLYYNITAQLKEWYTRQIRLPRFTASHSNPHGTFGPSFCPGIDVHLHLCYNAMRLVILYQFLHPSQPPPDDILIDCLETNLALLQALQHLKDIGCDQSTYHHMFFAIHNAAKRIYQYRGCGAAGDYAKEQLRINLTLLRGTQAYANDVFKVRLYAKTIEGQFKRLGISLEGWLSPSTNASRHPYSKPNSQSSSLPGTFVFRLQTPTDTRARSRRRL